MSRKKQSDGFLPSLFPFLSILTCTAGVLSFIIVSIGVVSILAPSIVVKSRDQAITIKKRPAYVECHADYLVLVQEQKKIPYTAIEDPNAGYFKFVKKIQQKADSLYIVFAIYPESERTFRKAYHIVRQINKEGKHANIDIGYEPFNKSWRLHAKKG
jgi:hypothetical protein